LYASGHSVIQISSILDRSRNWVYKWIERSASSDETWFLNRSTEPHNKPNQIDPDTEKAIVGSRIFLRRRDTPATRYAFCGAIGIHQDLDRKDIDQKPSLSTINRVLKRHGLTEEPNKSNHEKKKVYYPETKIRYPGFVHQLDLITPLYIAGYGKVVSVNRIDVFSSHAFLQQYDAKNADSILSFIIEDWKENGIPRYLQVDNEAAFRGGLYHPKTFGKLVRFCLNFGVQMIFIPFNEPWRNGHIESLNGRFQKLVWNRHRFRHITHLRQESRKFQEQHNKYQDYRKILLKTQPSGGYTIDFLPHRFSFNIDQPLPITTGLIHFVRQVNEDGKISILNEYFDVGKTYSYEYIWSVLNTREQSLEIYYKATKEAPKILVKKNEYKLRELVRNRIPISHFVS
jgi:transposase